MDKILQRTSVSDGSRKSLYLQKVFGMNQIRQIQIGRKC